MSDRTLEHLKERFIRFGLEAALERREPCMPSRSLAFDGEFAARLTRLACSQAPDGRSRWTVRLLVEKIVELSIVPSASVMTVQNTLKKELAPHLSKYWKIPPDEDASLVAAMAKSPCPFP